MATILAKDIIELRASNYKDDPRIDDLLILAAGRIGCSISGQNKELALALQCLHWMTISDRSGNGGVDGSGAGVGSVIEEEEGDLTLRYSGAVGGSSKSESHELDQTPWGIELKELLRGSFVYPRTRFSDVPCG